MLYRPGLLGRMPCPQDWYFDIGAPTLDEDLTGSNIGTWSFTRASANATNCLYTDGNAVTGYTTYATNQPRQLPFGLLMEPQRTNSFLNSEAPVTQNIAVLINSTYTVWCLGTGSVVLSGSGASGTVVAGTPITFTTTSSGIVTCTCTAPLTRVQFEAGASPTSYIITAGAGVTRAEDRISKNYLAGQLNTVQGTYWVEFMWNGVNYPNIGSGQPSAKLLSAGIGSYSSSSNTDQIELLNVPGTNFASGITYGGAGANAQSSITPIPRPNGGVNRIAMSVSNASNMIAMDYVLGSIGINTTAVRPTALLTVALAGGGAGPNTFNGFIRGFKYWPTAMVDAELKECTNPEYYKNMPPVFDLDGTNQNHWRGWTLQISAASSGVATDALMTDPPGTAYTQYPAANTAIRTGPRGILLDFNRFNAIPNSFAPAASGTTASLGVGTYYTASMRGTGSMTLSNGTGVSASMPFTLTQGMAVTFSVTTTGTFTWTSTGQLELAMIENIGGTAPSLGFNAQATSFVRTTTANQTKGLQGLSLPTGNWGQSGSFTVVVDIIPFTYTNSGIIIDVGDGTNTNTERLYLTYSSNTIVTNQVNTSNGVSQGGLTGTAPPPLNVLHKYAYNLQANAKRQMAADGVMLPPGNIGITRATNISTMRLGISNNVFFPWNCFIRRLRYYDYAIVDDALAALTIPDPVQSFSFMSGTVDPALTMQRTGAGATYHDASGIIRTSAANQPRWDCGPMGGPLLGLFCELPRTNLHLQSNNLALMTSASAPDNVTLTANVGTAPDSNTAAANIVPSTSVGIHNAYTQFTATNTTQYVYSVYLKQNGLSKVQLTVSGAYATLGVESFDLAVGVVLSGGSGTQARGIIQYPNGWYRCWIGMPATISAGTCFASIAPYNTALPEAGNGTSGVLGWGGQIESNINNASWPSSLIITTAASVVRGVEFAYMATNTSWFNPSAGTLYGEFLITNRAAIGNGNGPTIVELDDSTTNNTITNRVTGGTNIMGQCVIFASNVAQTLNITTNAVAQGAVGKNVVTYSPTNTSVCLNGGPVTSGPLSVIPPISRFIIGTGRVEPLTGYIRAIRYYNLALPDSDLPGLTT